MRCHRSRRHGALEDSCSRRDSGRRCPGWRRPLTSARVQTAALTEKDTVVLADFDNTTGDPVFDDALKQALAVHLGQSPFSTFSPTAR